MPLCIQVIFFNNEIINNFSLGTTNDTFLRENLEWLSKATNWSKFGVIAGLGTIHKGHLKDVLQILDPYLPKPNNSGKIFIK